MPDPGPFNGGIYLVEDRRVLFGETHGEERTPHETRRPVLIVSGRTTNNDMNWGTVSVCPLSTDPTKRTRFCVRVPPERSAQGKESWVRVPAVFPLSKDDLSHFQGMIGHKTYQMVLGMLAAYLGMTD